MKPTDFAKVIPVLERVSALKVTGSKELLASLGKSIKLASKMDEVNVDSVKPLYHVMEGGRLFLQEDKVEQQDRDKVMNNASQKIEDYFVTPISSSSHEKFQARKEVPEDGNNNNS
ncbi:glutamyl-tRNA(Gln) amidotransferase subunit C, mitochondrial [Brevipalpus obovatus]|uniref:glutamyl-tRNA(Gln) amidotransferase subunit C, mitochondrial n=1 Tax=Brevipalpus obovatus TaxID=246614 RepID=UPI003D9E867B